MKVKEIPNSIYNTLKLIFKSAVNLKKTDNKVEIPVIISLTSIESRLRTLHITVRSLLNQEVKPKKIVLWLNNNLKVNVPTSLKKLEGELFEICYSELTCSHRKLVHSLVKFPDEIIVTCDDDFIYQKDWMKKLYEEHLINPEKIIANQTRYISFNEQRNLLPYKQWRYNKDKPYNEKLILPIGAGGVLYPINSLANMVTNQNLFLKLTPKADDLWFKAMGLLNNTKSILSSKAELPIPLMGTQFESLKKHNVEEDKNRTQWQALMDYFELNLK